MRIPVYHQVADVLDHFGKCPRCGYPTQATETTRRFADGEVESETLVSCGMPCGWRGPTHVLSHYSDPITATAS